VPQPARPGINLTVLHALGLFVFVATAAALVAILITRLAGGLGSYQEVTTAFSLAVAAVACFAMIVDAVDAWVRGGSMTPQGRRMIRSLVSVALIAALATSLLGGTLQLMLVLGPALVVYLLIARSALQSAADARAGGPAASRSRAGGAPAKQTASRSRQRRGGKKRG